MQKTPMIEKIERILSPTAQSMGYELVRVLMLAEGSGMPTLQIMAERAEGTPDEGTMNVDDCEALSQAASALLDVEDVVGEAYVLEVSSPGIDRPLTRLKDFERYKNNQVRIELSEAIGQQKKFKGLLTGTAGEKILVDTETGPVALPFDIIERAKLVLTDDLIRSVTSQDNKKKKADRKAAREEKRNKRKDKKEKRINKT